MSSEPKRSAWTRKGRLTMIQMMFLELKVGGSWSCLMSSIDFNEEDAQPSKGHWPSLETIPRAKREITSETFD